MQRFATLIIALIMGLATASAQQLNAQQRKLKADIFNFLRKEVSNVTDSDDNEITFRHNDTKYFVIINPDDTTPMYVKFGVGFNLGNDYEDDIVARAGIKLNYYKCVKCYTAPGTIEFRSEMYMNDAKTFMASFRPVLTALEALHDSFSEEYDKAKGDAPAAKPSAASSALTGYLHRNDQEFYWPSTTKSTDSKLNVTKVTLEKDRTVVDFISYNGGEYAWCTIDRNSYITAAGKRYTMTKAEGIALSPGQTDYPNAESGQNVCVKFRLIFPALPAGTTEFSFSEGSEDGWAFDKILLEDAPTVAVKDAKVETGYHAWEVVSVQCLAGQTVVTKRCTPKTDGTYLYSSHEEYIEDADTGRKYYLMHSDIGFEGNPTTSYDTNPITYREVYPALPASTKHLSISSGTQYYVQNARIR